MSQTYVVITCTAANKAEMQELLYATDPLVFDITTGGGLNGPLWTEGLDPNIAQPTHWCLAGNIPTAIADLLGYN